jgi:hypothetical protein
MVVNSYAEYEDRAVEYGNSLKWKWLELKSCHPANAAEESSGPLHRNDSACDLNVGVSLKSPLYLPSQSISTPPISPFFVARKEPGSSYIHNQTCSADSTDAVTHMLLPTGTLNSLRRRLYLTRDSIPLFNTKQWVQNLEKGMIIAVEQWQELWLTMQSRNQMELNHVNAALQLQGDSWDRHRQFEILKWEEKLAGGKKSISNLDDDLTVIKRKRKLEETLSNNARARSHCIWL